MNPTSPQLSIDFRARVESPQTVAGLAEEVRALRGKQRAAANRGELLLAARRYAVEEARRKGEITADDVQERMAREIDGYQSWQLGNAAGSIFAGDRWQWTGRFRKSQRKGSNANPLRVWRLK